MIFVQEKPYEKKRWEDVAEDLSYQSDFQIHQTCEKFRSTKKFLLSEDLALESGKCRKLDELLPKIKEKVCPLFGFPLDLKNCNNALG